MTEKVFLVHNETKRRFEIVSIDAEKQTITLKGEHSTFVEHYDPALLKARGYRPEKVVVNV